jgi:hypothetical protein
MKTKDRQKMCLNCDARIPLEADQCPFCAYSSTQALHQSLTSLYTPPYAKAPENRSEPAPAVAEAAQAPAETKSAFWALLMLLLGGNLLTLGLLQFFFSDGGKLTLEWDSGYWFLYCLLAFPLFYFGFKKASHSAA